MQHLHAGLYGRLQNWLMDVVWQIEPSDRETKGGKKTERHTDFYWTTATTQPVQCLDTHTSLCNCHMQNKNVQNGC